MQGRREYEVKMAKALHEALLNDRVRHRRVAVRPERSSGMKASTMISPVRWLGMLVLLLMAVAVVYAGYTAIAYWPSISV